MECQETQHPRHPKTERKIAGAAGLVAFATFISRILGFVRDMVLANIFGATVAADAFYVAFRIPNMFRELFAEGSMSAGFIPVFTKYLTNRPREEAKALANSAFTTLFLLLAILTCLGLLFSPHIVSAIAPGFRGNPHQFHLTTTLTRIMFPFLFFVSLAALAMGILNSALRFGPPAFASGVFNVVSILFVLGLAPFFDEPTYAAAIGVTLGGLAQCLIQFPALRQEGFPFSFRRPLWPLHPGVIQMGKLILPTSVGLSVMQINLFVNTLLASLLPTGSVSFLYYGMRLIHFPLGIFAVALSTALLPTLSAQVAKGETAALRHTLSFGLRLIFFLTFPAMMGLIFLRIPIVHLLFEHGEFDAQATLGTANAILFYATGLWAFAGIRIVVPVFYALSDTKTPVKIGIISVVLNLVLNILLMRPLGYKGLALATSLSAIFNFSALLVILRRHTGAIDGRRILSSHIKTMIASLAIILPSFWVSRQTIWLSQGNFWIKGWTVTLTITGSMLGYFLVQAMLKGEESSFLWSMIRERFQKRGA